MYDISPLINFVNLHSNLAYGVVVLLAFSESVPIIGAVVPGTATIIAIAVLVPTGAVRLLPLLLAAIIGAIFGDGLSYWLGHRYGQAILTRWPLDRYPELVERSRDFINRHGGKSVFLARFAPGVRAFVPLSAGMLGMPPLRFYLANILSALAWAAAHIVPGALLGASLTLAGPAAGRLALLAGVLAILTWMLWVSVRIVVRRAPSVLTFADSQVRQWTEGRDTWLARQARALVDPERSEARFLLLWSGIVIGAAWLFFGILEDVATGDPLVRIDAIIFRALQGLRSPTSDTFMIGLTELGDPLVVAAVAVLVFLWLLSRRHWRTAAYWAGAVGFASFLNMAIKLAIRRPRPEALGYAGASQFSFPSGHTTVNAVMYGFLAFLVARRLRPLQRIPVVALVLSFVCLIAFSRLYLGAHWFSDVIGGFAFATAWIVVAALAYTYHPTGDVGWRGLAAVACFGVVLAGGAEIGWRHTFDAKRYAAQYKVPSMTEADWWNDGWRRLPDYRVDVTGEREEPLTLQWDGSPTELRQTLLKRGWRVPRRWSAASALAWLGTDDPEKLPVVPLLESGRFPRLALIRPVQANPHARYVLRLWPADVDIAAGTRGHLWLGSVVEEHVHRPLGVISLTHVAANFVKPREVVRPSIPNSRIGKRHARTPGWDGLVLLGRSAATSAQGAR